MSALTLDSFIYGERTTCSKWNFDAKFGIERQFISSRGGICLIGTDEPSYHLWSIDDRHLAMSKVTMHI